MTCTILFNSYKALYELKRIVQVIYEKDYRFAQPPKMPTISATAGDGEVILTWDDIADTRTRDPFVGNINDFEGYKVYRATDKYMADPEIITDGYGTPTFKKPIYQCDLIDEYSGFTDFGLVNGTGYNLGNNSGITHIFVDNTVQNGRTYYYAVVAYDFGAPDIGPGISPSENNTVIELDEYENIRSIGKNIAIVTPHQRAAGYIPPEVEIEESNTIGTGIVSPLIRAQGSLNKGHDYVISFDIDTVATISGYDYGIQYATSGINVHDLTLGELVYSENATKFIGNNLVYRDTVDYWTLNPNTNISSDVFAGLQYQVSDYVEIPEYSYENSGWINGSGIMRVTPSMSEGIKMPWTYRIVFTDNDNEYVGIATSGTVRDENGSSIGSSKINNQAVNFYIQNTSFVNESGSYDLMDIVIHDVNDNDVFDLYEDRIFVGATVGTRWRATAFVLDFQLSTETTIPNSGDVYQVDWKRPFFKTDSIRFSVNFIEDLDTEALSSSMDDIRVVPNPYVMSNMMEEAVTNPYLNQRRKIIFTNIPAQCNIKIFTVSGVLVDEIKVNNSPENGLIHWDMLTRESLEIAAGMYIYHVEASETGDTKIGKFAVIK